MKFSVRIFLSIAVILVWGVSLTSAGVRSVSTTSQLQSALDSAVAGDEIVLADGTYGGKFYIQKNAGTSSNPITIRAANKHKVIMQGNNACDRYQEGFVISKSWWIIKDLKFRDYGRAMSVNASNVEVHNNIIDHFREEGIRVEGASFAKIHDNVIAFGDGCKGDAPGIYLVNNADSNKLINNIIFATGDNGYTFGSKFGYGMLIANNSDDNLVQGNLIFGAGGKGTLRILGGYSVSSVDRNIIRDNALLWGEGELGTNDCVDDSNQWINNIIVGNYQAVWSSKGNFDGTKGRHLIQHNFFWMTPFSRIGADIGTGGTGCPNPSGVSYKIQNIVKDNIFYSQDKQSDFHLVWRVSSTDRASPPPLRESHHNLFWAPGGENTWVYGYTYQSTDIRQQPIITDVVNGDFSLAAGSPGKNAASDGTDVGITYNSFLKKHWLRNTFNLETQQKNVSGTSTTFSVSPNHFYQMWFYIPNTPCSLNAEKFIIEGITLSRDIAGLTTGNIWIQPGGPARWITLGRHKATDGVLNVSWTNSACTEKIFIRRLPNADEAYQWFTQTAGPVQALQAPTNLEIIQNP